MSILKRCMSRIEIIVIVVTITIFVGVLNPVFINARMARADMVNELGEKILDTPENRVSYCISNLRHLAMAADMFSWDNKNHMPGIYSRKPDGSFSSTYTGWAGDVFPYVKGGTPDKMFLCPEVPDGDIKMLISYGYNSALLMSDGTGIYQGEIKQPCLVGVFCDTSPGIPFPAKTINDKTGKYTFGGGGIIGGYSILFSGTDKDQVNKRNMGSGLSVYPDGRHNGGVVIGYADGRASFVPDKFNDKDCNNGVVRAFYRAIALGFVNNPAAGLGGNINNPFGEITATTGGKSFIVIGGDSVTRPILIASCEVAKKIRPGFNYKSDGFNGSLTIAKRPVEYLEGVVATDIDLTTKQFVQSKGSYYQIGVDSMVVVVSKDCAIKTETINLTDKSSVVTDSNNKIRCIGLKDLQTIIRSNGYSSKNNKNVKKIPHEWSMYIQGNTDGSRNTIAAKAATLTTEGGFGAHFTDGGYFGQTDYIPRCAGGVKEDADTFYGTYCCNDMDIVDKVSNDELGIGIVSAAYADPEKVDILAITIGEKEETVIFPNPEGITSGIYQKKCKWPFRRNLYVYFGGPGSSSRSVAKLSFDTYKDSFKQGPLYKASFWTPESW